MGMNFTLPGQITETQVHRNPHGNTRARVEFVLKYFERISLAMLKFHSTHRNRNVLFHRNRPTLCTAGFPFPSICLCQSFSKSGNKSNKSNKSWFKFGKQIGRMSKWTNLFVKILFAFPFLLADRVIWCKCQRLFAPAQHVRIQFQCESSFRVIFSLQMQIVQFVNVPVKYLKMVNWAISILVTFSFGVA